MRFANKMAKGMYQGGIMTYRIILQSLSRWLLVPAILYSQLYGSLDQNSYRQAVSKCFETDNEYEEYFQKDTDETLNGNLRGDPEKVNGGNRLDAYSGRGVKLGRYESGEWGKIKKNKKTKGDETDTNKTIRDILTGKDNKTISYWRSLQETTEDEKRGLGGIYQSFADGKYDTVMKGFYKFVINKRFDYEKERSLCENLHNLWNYKPDTSVAARSSSNVKKASTKASTHTEFLMIYDILPDSLKLDMYLLSLDDLSDSWYEKMLQQIREDHLLPHLMCSAKAMCPVCEVFLTSLYELCGQDARFVSVENTYNSPDANSDTHLKKVFLNDTPAVAV